MARKRHSAEEIVAKLCQVDVLTSQGRLVAEAVRSIGVEEVTYYRWRREYGGLKDGQVKGRKSLRPRTPGFVAPEAGPDFLKRSRKREPASQGGSRLARLPS